MSVYARWSPLPRQANRQATRHLKMAENSDTRVTSAQSKWISMSYVYDNETLSFGTLTRYKQSLVFEGGRSKDVPYYLSFDLSLSEHSGTHIDAPVHFSKGMWTVDQIPPEKLIAPVVVVNISEKASKDRNALLTVPDLETWEKSYGRIPDDSVLLVHTGWGKYYPDEEKYFGMKTKNISLYQFPGISGAAAKWLVDNRKINGVGIDTASMDYGKSQNYPCHQILYKENIYGLENVANIGKLPAKGATIYIMPMNLKGGSGAPARILAKLQDEPISYGSRNIANTNYYLLLTLFGTHLIGTFFV